MIGDGWLLNVAYRNIKRCEKRWVYAALNVLYRKWGMAFEIPRRRVLNLPISDVYEAVDIVDILVRPSLFFYRNPIR